MGNTRDSVTLLECRVLAARMNLDELILWKQHLRDNMQSGTHAEVQSQIHDMLTEEIEKHDSSKK